jgi:hypothetical protein
MDITQTMVRTATIGLPILHRTGRIHLLTGTPTVILCDLGRTMMPRQTITGLAAVATATRLRLAGRYCMMGAVILQTKVEVKFSDWRRSKVDRRFCFWRDEAFASLRMTMQKWALTQKWTITAVGRLQRGEMRSQS